MTADTFLCSRKEVAFDAVYLALLLAKSLQYAINSDFNAIYYFSVRFCSFIHSVYLNQAIRSVRTCMRAQITHTIVLFYSLAAIIV